MSFNNIVHYQVDNIAYKELQKYKKPKYIEKECAICFTVINNKTKIIQFSCGHMYHYSCFKKWCKQSGHVFDQCISCNTVRSYTIIPKKKEKKEEKEEKEEKEKKCILCMIQ